jgi:hypothetical protein
MNFVRKQEYKLSYIKKVNKPEKWQKKERKKYDK